MLMIYVQTGTHIAIGKHITADVVRINIDRREAVLRIQSVGGEIDLLLPVGGTVTLNKLVSIELERVSGYQTCRLAIEAPKVMKISRFLPAGSELARKAAPPAEVA